MFSLFPTPATCRTGCRLTPTGGGGRLPVAAIRTQRVRVNGFASAAVGAHALVLQLGDLVLGGEAAALRPVQQSAVLANAGDAVDAQFGLLAVESDQSVTLTARSGRVPDHHPVERLLPGGRHTHPQQRQAPLPQRARPQWTQSVLLRPRYSTVVYVRVQTRASGVFRLDISLHSPDGSVRLATGELSVRSTASSVVGVVLTAGAVAVLAVWWFRTSRRRRAAGRADEADDTAGAGRQARDPAPVAVGTTDGTTATP